MSDVLLQINAGTPDLYHRSPDSCDVQYKLRGPKKTICSSCEGWQSPGHKTQRTKEESSLLTTYWSESTTSIRCLG
jgi:hypothetical protein